MRKPAVCICQNKGADQLRSNCAAYLRLSFHYTDSTIPLLLNPKFQGRPVFSRRRSNQGGLKVEKCLMKLQKV